MRVVNFAGFSANKNIKLALDNFNNPPIQKLFLVPISLKMRLQDRSSEKIYYSYFPNIYYSDSIDLRNTVQSTGSLSPTTNSLGNSNQHKWSFSWPYNSGSNVWDKILVQIHGGITCCQSYSSLASFSDQYGGFTALWVNTKANTTVYQMKGSRSTGQSMTFYINNVINPNPVNYADYEKGKEVTIKFITWYKLYNIYRLSQPNYSSYGRDNDFVMGTASYVSGSKPAHHYSHQYYPLTYEFYWDVKANSYNGRNISYILLEFTNGVRWIDAAWFRYYSSVINKVGSAAVGFNSNNNRWYVNITGVQDSHFSASNHWYLRVRLYANNNNRIYYTSHVYNYNGQLEFNSQSPNLRPSDYGSFSTSSNYGLPSMWKYQHLRYTHGYHELQRKTLYAKSGQTTNKLFFKFTAPYNISEI